MKDSIYNLLMTGNINWMRSFLVFTSYLTAFIMLLPGTFHPAQYIFFVNPEISNSFWFFLYSIYSLIGSFNLMNDNKIRKLFVVEGTLGFLIYGVSTAFSLVVYQYTVSTAPLIMATFLSWCVLLVVAIRK